MTAADLEPQNRYLLQWALPTGSGYEIETGEGIYVYVGPTAGGKMELRPHGQWIHPEQETIYLFPDEITGVVRLP